jgi:hypothetical protein
LSVKQVLGGIQPELAKDEQMIVGLGHTGDEKLLKNF